jgi:[acyl-carrier-protein] S-malonyltransferase
MSLGLLFTGQGAQHAAMLPWLDDSDDLVRRTVAALGVPDWRQALHDTAWGATNRNAQILLTGLGLAAWAQLRGQGLPAPAAVAGYSVGELAAFSCAGVLEAATAIDLAARRAHAMDRAAEHSPGGLLAITGLDAQALETWCAGHGCTIAIKIAADSVVVGGPPSALQAIHQHAQALGAKCSALNVAVASHTPAMQPAAADFAQVLRASTLQPPATALFCNASADRVFTAAQAADALSTQIAHTVQWSACLDALHARRLSCVLEIGPGSALAALWNRRHPDVPARSADEFRSIRSLLGWVTAHLAGP